MKMKSYTIKVFFLCSMVSTLFGNNEARLLLDGNCITCHHETKAHSASSLKEIQKRYKAAFPNKKEFVLLIDAKREEIVFR